MHALSEVYHCQRHVFPSFVKSSVWAHIVTQWHIFFRGRGSVTVDSYLPEGLFVKLYVSLGIVGGGGGNALEFWSLCISLVMGLV